jgi:hypothetical protein
MNEAIVKEFVEFYYGCLNQQNTTALIPHLKDHSSFIRDQSSLSGIDNVINGITKDGIFYNPIKCNIVLNGSRRANILISGKINKSINYCEYILLSLSNKKEFWIHSSMLHTIN